MHSLLYTFLDKANKFANQQVLTEAHYRTELCNFYHYRKYNTQRHYDIDTKEENHSNGVNQLFS